MALGLDAQGIDVTVGVICAMTVCTGYGVLCLVTRQRCSVQIRATTFLVVFISLIFVCLAVEMAFDIHGGSFAADYQSGQNDNSTGQNINKTWRQVDQIMRNHNKTPQIGQMPVHWINILIFLSPFLFSVLLHPDHWSVILRAIPHFSLLPALQILLPIYMYCNMADQSWGTREQNRPRDVPTICPLKRPESEKIDWDTKNEEKVDMKEEVEVTCSCHVQYLKQLSDNETEFWETLRNTVIGTSTEFGLSGDEIGKDLGKLRSILLPVVMAINITWLIAAVVTKKTSGSEVFTWTCGVFVAVGIIQVLSMVACKIQSFTVRAALRTDEENARGRAIWIKR
ncbi:chitin synthase 1-like [Lingula anatina]|uniref:Chitin synthase 1-like n=1 Tax=Lingula anatina TaxID=7574 RepID=A0A1S3I1D9_LINAN|nr:chitin synthase 1-like [Lingula anatina]|eukprot:XP_013391646.1 chitin synthase 1-like [Lingula anatina]